MDAIKLLLVEDEPRLAEYLRKGLEENGYVIDIAYDGEIGKNMALKNSYDLMVFDLNLPKINGIELTKQLRNESIHTMIMILTAMNTTPEKISGFNAGADDYLVKPFDFTELIARLKALYRRTKVAYELKKNLVIADLELDLNEKIATRNGNNISLTQKEFSLLEYFMRHQGMVISRTEIAERVWNINFDTASNSIDVYMNFLRNKIDKNYNHKLLHTVIGMGYMMKA